MKTNSDSIFLIYCFFFIISGAAASGGENIRKFFIYLIPFILLCTLCGITASAETVFVPSYAVPGYEDTDADVFAPQASSTRFLDIESRDWYLEGDYSRRRHRSAGGRIQLVAQLDPDEAENGYTSYIMELDEYSAGRYNTIAFGILADNCAALGLSIDISVVTVDEELTARVRIEPNSWNMIYMDASLLESRITSMTVTVNYAGDLPESVTLTKPYLAKNSPAGFTYAERVSANTWNTIAGTAMIRSGRIRPDDNGQAMITAPLITTTRIVPGSAAYFEIHLNGVVSGNMTLGVLYAGAAEEQRQMMRKVSLNASDGVYTIPVTADTEIISYSLAFDNMVCEEDAITVQSLRVYGSGNPPIGGNSDIGTVESLTRTGSRVVFSGILERQAASVYSSHELHFYAIPGWHADDLSYAVDLGGIKITTRFQHTVDLSALGAASAADTFRFFAGIPTEDGIMTLSPPRYPDAPPVSVSTVSNMGLYAAASVGVFESNASNVMLELPLDELIRSSGGLEVPYALLGSEADTGVFSQSGMGSFHLNEELLRTLDSEINFYLSAGIRVYLRLTAASPVPGLTYGGENYANYAVSASGSESRQMYAALIRTLSARWDRISGISLGRGVNYGALVGDASLENAAVYATELAELCRITYSAASAYVPDVTVIVPYVEYMTDEQGDALWLPDRTLAVMLAHKLDEMGSIPWVLMYCVDSTEDDLTSPVTLSRTLTDLELESPAGLMLFWQPTVSDLTRQHLIYNAQADTEPMDMSHFIANRFGMMCAAGEKFRARAVFLSMANFPDGAGQTFFEYLKNESAGDSGRYVYDSVAEDVFARPETDAELVLWDFSDKHHTLGWIAGGGVSSCLTDYSSLFSKKDENGVTEYVRVLRGEVDLSGTASGAAGIMMCNFDERLNFTGIEGMDFTVAVEQRGLSSLNANRDTVTLVFVIGTEDTRAEYYAKDVKCGEIRSFHCSLADYPYLDAIDYVGVMVYSDFAVNLDIAEVHMHSSVLNDEDVQAMLGTAQPEETLDGDAYRLALILCAVVIVMSVAAVAALTRHENEETMQG